ncbi:hypothetical protein DS884_06780 [Tenacibaculum sp. E3R01]|nr:hypothetical protein [Tenacibaculum sp. E3R01]RBW59438.1 hypothetical protein DS884_06780 [Tenacibaculum sp. E3R01]
MDDLNTGLKSTFQLVHRKVHAKTTQHMGSFYQIEKLLELIKL